MELSFIFIVTLFSAHLLFDASLTSANSIDTNLTDFSCSASPCYTYLTYRTQSPDFLDLGHVSDLFGVSRLNIMKANNLPSVDVTFSPNQLVFVPISCGCTGNRSFTNVTYYIKLGDTFYFTSISAFENLTDYQAVQDLNPTLVPTKLNVRQEVIFPLYCQCPVKAQLDQGINFLVTYVWQLGDDISTLSAKMNTSVEALMIANNYRNLSASVALPILVPMSTSPQFPPPLYYNTTASLGTQYRKPGPARAPIIASSLLGSVLALMLFYFLVATYRKGYPEKCMVRTTSTLETTDLIHSKDISSEQTLSPRMVDKLLTVVTEYLDKPLVFEAKTIVETTMNLDQRFRLGTSVYRATLNKEVFAVKKCKGDVTEEVNILQKVNHANLVKLVGVSTEIDGNCFLVYEFAENGSLDKWLYPQTSSSSSVYFLSWKQRLTIALDIANGLQYMHEHTRPNIVHRDIRTRNILLSASFKAKISNFSIAQPASDYITPAIDVFGFGIILLELLSGRKAMETKVGGQISMSWKEIRTALQVEEKVEEKLKQWMDPRLGEFYPIDGALSLATMARACTSETLEERPRMSEIVFSLSILAHSCTSDLLRAHSCSVFGETAGIIASSPIAR